MELYSPGSRAFRQVVKRPSGMKPLDPFEWVSTSALAYGVSLELVEQAMSHHVPKLLKSSSSPPSDVNFPNGFTSAGVLIPIFDADDEAHMILTRRSSSLRTHAGEIAFPGGKLEEGETLEQAALREAYEEIGLDLSTVKIQGRLLAASTMSSLISLVAVVATLPKPESYRLNTGEVEKVFSFPISYLFKKGVHAIELWPYPNGGQREMHFFDFGDDLVWGATARILYEFMWMISRYSLAS